MEVLYSSFCRIASPDSTIISIDLPSGPFGGGYPSWRIPLYRTFTCYTQRVYLLREDSHNMKTLSKVRKILCERKLDFLFIDGDHTYEGVKMDFERYSPLVRKSGIIAFHDITPHDRVHDPEGFVGVPKFWSEIKGIKKHLEIIRNHFQGWAGIGVLIKE